MVASRASDERASFLSKCINSIAITQIDKICMKKSFQDLQIFAQSQHTSTHVKVILDGFGPQADWQDVRSHDVSEEELSFEAI